MQAGTEHLLIQSILTFCVKELERDEKKQIIVSKLRKQCNLNSDLAAISLLSPHVNAILVIDEIM